MTKERNASRVIDSLKSVIFGRRFGSKILIYPIEVIYIDKQLPRFLLLVIFSVVRAILPNCLYWISDILYYDYILLLYYLVLYIIIYYCILLFCILYSFLVWPDFRSYRPWVHRGGEGKYIWEELAILRSVRRSVLSKGTPEKSSNWSRRIL